MKLFHSLLLLAALGVSAFAGVTRQQTQQAASHIDALLAADWKSAGANANPPVNDATFLRRIYLDLAGRIPTAAEATAFLDSKQPGKRAALIDELLSRESYVSNFYNLWADILRFKSQFTNSANVVPTAYEQFIKKSLRTNKPYDQFVREMLSAKGTAWDNGAVGYYQRDPDMPLDNMALTARIFLGTRIECAQCHNHPFDKWKQTDFYRLSAYTIGNKQISEGFNGVREAFKAREQAILDDFKLEKAASTDGGKAAEQRKNERIEAMEFRKVLNTLRGGVGHLFSPIGTDRRMDAVLKLPPDFEESGASPGDVMRPRPIFGQAPEVGQGSDGAEIFAQWATSPQNPCFTRVIVNRLWKRMFGVALTEPLDELRDDTKAMVPEVETYLQKLMVALKYDMRAFLAVVANTQAYQAAVTTEEFAAGSTYHFTGPVLRRMTAEQVWDSLVALGSYDPDAHDVQRDARNERRINVSRMAYDAYQAFDGKKLVDIGYARLATEKEIDVRDRAAEEEKIKASRLGDKERVRELAHLNGEFDRERGDGFVRDFLMPVLTNLAQKKAGPNAKPVVDETYKMNANPAVFAVETWKRMWVPGYGPAPKNAAQIEVEAQAEKQRLGALAAKLGFPEKEHTAFIDYSQRAKAEWVRASELDSPAPRGHFLRTMGQSDRDFVENANPNASIPQALALMNSDLISPKGLLSPYSPLMHFVAEARTAGDKVDAAYLALLSRRPTAQERAVRTKASRPGRDQADDLIYALLNTKQFIFIQ